MSARGLIEFSSETDKVGGTDTVQLETASPPNPATSTLRGSPLLLDKSPPPPLHAAKNTNDNDTITSLITFISVPQLPIVFCAYPIGQCRCAA